MTHSAWCRERSCVPRWSGEPRWPLHQGNNGTQRGYTCTRGVKTCRGKVLGWSFEAGRGRRFSVPVGVNPTFPEPDPLLSLWLRHTGRQRDPGNLWASLPPSSWLNHQKSPPLVSLYPLLSSPTYAVARLTWAARAGCCESKHWRHLHALFNGYFFLPVFVAGSFYEAI